MRVHFFEKEILLAGKSGRGSQMFYAVGAMALRPGHVFTMEALSSEMAHLGAGFQRLTTPRRKDLLFRIRKAFFDQVGDPDRYPRSYFDHLFQEVGRDSVRLNLGASEVVVLNADVGLAR
jgi:hypothetical protein